MQMGVGLDARLRLSLEDQRTLVREAAELGYTSAWTPASATGFDAFHTCAQWHAASGLETGISVVPMPTWTVPTLASQAATVGQLTAGKFVLGIGPGSLHDEQFRASYDVPAHPPVAYMRDALRLLRRLLDGEEADYQGRALRLHGVSLSWKPPRVPVYLAAMGPQMLRLAGELSDGVLPNWASPRQIAWCRERVDEGALRAGRAAGSVPIAQYIRVCVDEDVAAARRAFALQVLGYGLARPGASKELGYRGHFGRMGFDEIFSRLEARRAQGEPLEALAAEVPDDLLLQVGYFGAPDGAAEAFARLAEGLDTAVVRVVSARPGPDAVRVALTACQPSKVLPASARR